MGPTDPDNTSGFGSAPALEDRPESLPPPEEEHHGPFAWLRELPGLIIVAFLLALLIKTFLVQAFFIPSSSMENTLEIGDRVLVNKVVYRFHQPERGDIIVFENPHPVTQPDRNPIQSFVHWLTEGLGFSSDPEKDFIKRLIALPGETIELRKGDVYIDGKLLHEDYAGFQRDQSDYPPFKVPAGTYFMMGDNRANSSDSRTSLGPIPRDKLVGKAFIILWPAPRFEWSPED